MESQIQMSLILTKYQKHIACSYGYKLVYNYDKFSKPFKSYLGKDPVCNFISSMIKESEYCKDVMKKHFNKELVMTEQNNEDLENSTKCWTGDNDYIDGDVKVRIIVISLKNIEILSIEIVISTLN